MQVLAFMETVRDILEEDPLLKEGGEFRRG